MSKVSTSITRGLKAIFYFFFPQSLFLEWPFICLFCILSAPFQVYFIFRAIFLPEVWFSNFKELTIVLFYAYVFARIIVVFKSRIVRNIVRSIFYIFALIQFAILIVAFSQFGMSISPELFTIILQTDPHEIQGFCETFINPIFIYLVSAAIAILSVIFAFEHFKDSIIHGVKKFISEKIIIAIKSIVIICIIIGFIFNLSFLKTLCMDYADIHKWRFDNKNNGFNNNVINCTIFSIVFIGKGNSEYKHWEEFQTQLKDSQGSEKIESDSLNIVFVLGESFIRSHSQLYGYKHPTTTNQQSESAYNNIVVFKDISTIAKITDVVIGNVFSLNNVSLKETWHSAPFFPIIMKKAGWDIYHYDNNVVGTSFFNKLAGSMFKSKIISDLCFSDVYIPQNKIADNDFLCNAFGRSQNVNSKNKLTIIHLFGQHVPFKGAVPEGWERFGVEDYRYRKEPWMDDERRQMIADYDNATFANDSVMGMIYNHFRDKNAVVVYVSDHGEEVYDYRDSMGRKNRTDNTMEQYIESFFMVSATVWMSPKFKELYPGKVDAIKKAATRRGSIDDIGHFILGLAEVSSPYYRPERDIASESYRPVRRLTTEGFYIDPE